MAFPTTKQAAPLSVALTPVVDDRCAVQSVRIDFPAMQPQRKPPLASLTAIRSTTAKYPMRTATGVMPMRAERPNVANSSDTNISDFSDVAARLVEAACFARDGNGEAAKAQIARAIALLRGDPSRIPANPPPVSGGVREIARGGMAAWQKRRLIVYIDANLSGRIRIEDLAELLNLSESQFSRVFRCAFGTSAHEYLTRRRIEVAQSLMLTTREPLCSIALRCGLSDQSHLTRVFRRIVGETPYAWRRTRQGEIADRPTEPSGNPRPLKHFETPARLNQASEC
jgi:AraC family transcriptional regulator